MTKQSSAARMFTAGIACHALILAEALGILPELSAGGIRQESVTTLASSSRSTKIDGCLRSLVYAGLAESSDGIFRLTADGREAVENIGIFRLWFGGYAAYLGNYQALADDNKEGIRPDSACVARSSADVGSRLVDPQFFAFLDRLELKGGIADIGCGTAARLIAMCKKKGVTGLGIDISAAAADLAQRNVIGAGLGDRIRIAQGDATRIDAVYPGIELVMHTFMTHHIGPDEFCARVLKSYRTCFPDSRTILILETVTPTECTSAPTLFAPGFDFVHRLQGVVPRTRESALQVFADAGLKLVEEIAFDVPNSFLWQLSWT